MPSTTSFRKLATGPIAAIAALSVAAACKTSSASGGSGSAGGSTMATADGGMAGADGGMAAPDDGGSIAHDIGQGAGTAAGNVASGVQSAARGVADAGAAAAGAAKGAATTAAEAAREAAAGARSGVASAMDGGASTETPPETPGPSDGGLVESAETASATGGAPLNDAQVAAVALAANAVDIEAARLARRKSRNAQVKKFASEMIRDHASSNEQAAALVKKLGMTPEENDASRGLEQGGKENLSNLMSMKGKQFDRAYAEHEVAYHQEVLEALDRRLIPAARDAGLKSLLRSVRSMVARHLDHAAALVDALSK